MTSLSGCGTSPARHHARRGGAGRGEPEDRVARGQRRGGRLARRARPASQRAVDQLGYRHNLAASNLRRTNARTGTVGALLQDVSNSFSASLLRSLEDAARAPRRGGPRREPRRGARPRAEPRRRAWCAAGSTASCSCPPAERQDYLVRRAAQRHCPSCSSTARPHGVDADSVTVDNRAVALRLATEPPHRTRATRASPASATWRPSRPPPPGCAASARPTPQRGLSTDPRLVVIRAAFRGGHASGGLRPAGPRRAAHRDVRGAQLPRHGGGQGTARPRPSTRDRAGGLRRLPACRCPRSRR